MQAGAQGPYGSSQCPVGGMIGINHEKAEQVSPPLPENTGLFSTGHVQVRALPFFLFTKPRIDKVQQTAAYLNSLTDKLISEHVTRRSCLWGIWRGK